MERRILNPAAAKNIKIAGATEQFDEARAKADKTCSTQDEILEDLALLDPIDYDQRRAQVAQDLGIRVKILDVEVARRRTLPDDPGELSQLMAEPQLWPDPVDGVALLDDIADAYTEHAVLPEGGAESLALWDIHAHAHDAFDVSPLICLTSPDKRCGKSTVLDVNQRLVPKPLLVSNLTKATVFRAVEKWKPTLLLDEVDTFMKNDDELRGVLDSGHLRDTAFVLRCEGDSHEPTLFRTWAPKMIALIGKLPPTLEDRSITISMKRKLRAEKITKLRPGKNPFTDLRSKAARWVRDNFDALVDCDPEVPPQLHDRAADNWRPLLAIADLAGGNWPDRARQAAILLEIEVDDDAAAIMLLTDIKLIFEKRGKDHISSQDLCTILARMEDRPWPEWKRGKPITPTQVARLLKPFSISPRQVWSGRKNVRGYQVNSFQDTFARYLDDSDARPLEPMVTAADSAFEDARSGAALADEKSRKAKQSAVSSALAGQIGRARASAKNKGEVFIYRPRTYAQIKARAEQTG